MAVKKATKKAPAGDKPKKLMDQQDLKRKGDSTSNRKKDKCITFWVTDEYKSVLAAFAAEHNTTVSRLIIEGLELRMSQD